MKKVRHFSFFLTLLFLLTYKVPFSLAAQCGINIDPANPGGFPTPQSVAGAGWVRMEFKECTTSNDPANPNLKQTLDAYRSLLEGYKSVGLKTLLIIDYDSYPSGATNISGFAERAGLIAEQLGSVVDAYEIWNEPDIEQGRNLSPSQYAALLSAAAGRIGSGATIISAGLASGNPGYLSSVVSSMGSSWGLIDGVGIHPYGANPGPDGSSCDIGNSGDLLNFLGLMAQAGGGKPLWITEIGLMTEDLNLQARYLECFYQRANAAGVANITWFAWSDAMVNGWGLMNSNMSAKPAANRFNAMCNASLPANGSNQAAITLSGGSCGGGPVSPAPSDLACGPIQQAGSGGFNLFGSLLSFFSQIQLPNLNLFARYAQVLDTMQEMDNLNETAYNRVKGMANKDAAEPMTYVTIAQPHTWYLRFFPLPINFLLPQDLKQDAKSVGSWIPDYTISDVSPTGKPADTIRGYYNGLQAYDPEFDIMLRKYRDNPDPNKASSPVLFDIYKKSGVASKLYPPQAFSINAGGFKGTKDAWRDETMGAVFNYLICALEINKDNCSKPITDHDLIAGWIYNSAQFPSGPDGPEVSAATDKSSMAYAPSVWYSETRFTPYSRPMLVSGIGCTNPTWTVGKYFTLAEKNQACRIVYGDNYGGGTCLPGSLCYDAFDYPLRVPPEAALYPHIWNLVSLARVKDPAGKVRWTFSEREEDQERGESQNLVLGENETYTLPGGMTHTSDVARRIGDMVSPLETNRKRENQAVDIPSVQCLQNAVGGKINDAIAGFQISNDNYLFKAAKFLNIDILGNIFSNVRGVTTTPGQVLQAVTPPAVPAPPQPTPPPQGSHIYARDSEMQIGIPKSALDPVRYISHPETGLACQFLPFEICQNFQKTIGGVPIYMLPTALKTDFEGGDYKFGYDPQTVYPAVGGPVLANKLLQQLVLPREVTVQANAGRMLKDLASYADPPAISATPWTELASYKKEGTDLSLK